MRLRGAKPSPRPRLAGATPHRIVGATPTQFLWSPVQLSFWYNQIYGCCVTSEEAAAKSAYSKVFIPDDVVLAWATANGDLNGDTLIDVLDKMQVSGFPLNGNLYNDGEPNAVEWTNEAMLQNALAQGPVKLGVAADQLESAVPDPPTNGWLAQNFAADQNLDHCVGLLGFGPVGWMAAGIGCAVPSGVEPSKNLYTMFTWDSLGFIDFASLCAITGEAWVRNPTTVVKSA